MADEDEIEEEEKQGKEETERKIPDIRQNFAELGFNPDSMKDGWEALYEVDKEADDLIAEELGLKLENVLDRDRRRNRFRNCQD